MAETAVAESVGTEAVPAQAEGSEPQGTGAAAEVAGSEQQGQAGAEQPKPEGSEQAAGQPTPPQDDMPHVPWARFRQAQTERTQARNILTQKEKEWGQRESELTRQIEEAKAGTAEQQQVIADYQTLSSALRQNPDIARALMERLGETPAQGSQPRFQGVGAAQPEAESPTLKRLGETVESLNQRFQQSEQAQREAQERAEKTALRGELENQVGSFLERKGFDPRWKTDAVDYVIKKASEEMPDLELDDVPYVLSLWFKDRNELIQAQVARQLEGKKADASLPPSPGAAQGPVRQQQPMGANDEVTNQRALESLTRLGWTG